MIPFKDDNPSRTFPFVMVGLIIINIIVFIWEMATPMGGEQIAVLYGAIPHDLITLRSDQMVSPLASVFTSMFLHGGFFHIAGNMLYLWIFGDNIEDALGHFRFLLFYLFSGVVAAYGNALTDPESMLPMIGASGAISGVLGAYILLFPRARVHTLLFFGFFWQVVRIPAVFVIGFWIVIQLVSGLLSAGTLQHGGIAWFAHVGGFLAGILTIKLWLPQKIRF
ncbi:MAG TPA: rhomboid family intramembrane serine protease [Dissulfurispiraceae bacterium]|nr:rhomboid family intramembrane serine protease [Dissulfurispiraceae bacterium]